jgi:hypothetical protein
MNQISYYDQTVRTFAENGRWMKLGLAQVGWKLRHSTFVDSCRNANEEIDEDIRLSESQLFEAIDEAWEKIR